MSTYQWFAGFVNHVVSSACTVHTTWQLRPALYVETCQSFDGRDGHVVTFHYYVSAHEHSACITHTCESLCCETNHRFAAAATHVFVIHEECKEHLDQSVIIICKCVFSLTVPLPKTSTVKSRLFLWLLTALMWPTCRWLQPLAMSECSQRVSNGVLPSVQPVLHRRWCCCTYVHLGRFASGWPPAVCRMAVEVTAWSCWIAPIRVQADKCWCPTRLWNRLFHSQMLFVLSTPVSGDVQTAIACQN